MIFGNEEYPNITAYLVSILLNIPYQLVKGKIVFKNTKNNNFSLCTDIYQHSTNSFTLFK